MAIHKIDLYELSKWANEQKIIYASCRTKRLSFCLYGSWEIEIKRGGKWHLYCQGMQPFTAVESYNKLP